jgi:molecular chaperone GrpE
MQNQNTVENKTMKREEDSVVEEESLENEAEMLKSKMADLEDQLLRAVAEVQNIQKRAEKEKTDISKYSIAEFARDVLRIRDTLQLALNNSNESPTAIVDGIKLTMAEMDKILANYKITMIESLGKIFDPHFHQAMIEIDSPNEEPGIIVQVMQEGFMIHDRLLRPALVGVSKK